MPRLERSAGFVLFRTDPDAPGGRVFLLLDYGRHWDYPKGHVESGETDYDAAIRELHEETALRDPHRVGEFSYEIEYYFRSKKKGLVRKQVVFFLASTDSQAVRLSDEHVGFAFLPFDVAIKRLTYASARAVLRAAERYLRESS